MKSFFKKLAFVMALAMVVSLAAPAAKSALAATEFTYAYQEGGKVTALNMKANDEVDLRFIGVKDYKNYTLEWKSSNPQVATVDNKGIVKAVENGTTDIELVVGDGSVYTSTPVKVTVGEEVKVALGTAKDNTFTSYTLEMGETVDLNFYGVPNFSVANYTCTWVSSAPEVVSVDPKGILTPVAAGTAVVTVAIVNNVTGETLDVVPVEVTVKKSVEELTAKQTTATKVSVQFTGEHTFDATGTDADGKNTVKVYRVFTTEEMAKMTNKNGLKFDEEGNGYQAYYVKDTSTVSDKDFTKWVIEGYNAFVDGAKYAVVYGANETSSTIEGIKTEFTAYVGKVAYIKITATDATIENDVEPAIAAILTTKLYNSHDIDLTDYYKNADETDYELVTEDIDVSISGDEVTFDEVGVAKVKGTYTFYDEDLEEDVICDAYVDVKGTAYSTYRVDSIYNWSLKSGYKSKWSATTTEMIAGDADQLYVIVVDNRGNYYSNVPGIESTGYKINNKPVLEIGDGNDNTAFEQYGYELVFDSLDPDSLLVDEEGYVESYKKTNSFAVVSYRRSDDENAKVHEIGVMGITVKAARKLDSVKYSNGTSFTILKETEAEDGVRNYYSGYDDFKLSATLKVEFLNQYGKAWGTDAEDYGEVETNFTVTTTKDEFKSIAEDIADALNDDGKYTITSEMFEGTNTTSVSFKIKERATGDSETVTIKLDKPKYVTDANGDETEEVFVDPTKANISTGNIEMYSSLSTAAKLFQVSKASQKIGYFRIGTAEMADEGHGYYVANDLTKNFVVATGNDLDFVTTASSSALTTVDLKVGDYILVVTDPQGKVFPAQGCGGNDKSFGAASQLGVVASADGTAFDIVVAAVKDSYEMEYAVNGTYRATVYKVTNIVDNKNTDGEVISTKYNTSRVSSDSFVVSKTLSNVSFYHQETTKNVEVSSFATVNDIKTAIEGTMTFRINGANLRVADGQWYYKSNVKYKALTAGDTALDGKTAAFDDYHWLPIDLDTTAIDYKIQNDGKRAVVNTVTFKLWTPAGGYYLSKVKVNRSVNAAE